MFDFEKARTDKYAAPVYVAAEEIEVPEFVREAVADQHAIRQRGLLRVATRLIDSGDIPRGGESDANETIPSFQYSPTEKRL